jgi:putative chitobiose transport system substrate-binding protein
MKPLRVFFMVLLAAAALLMPAVSGCRRPGKDSSASRVDLEFWTISLHPTYDGYIRDIIAVFEKENPGIKIEWIDIPINVVMQKLMASIAGGISPDLVNLNSEYAMVLSQNNALVDMDAAVPVEVRKRYFPGLWRAAEYEGRNYAIPWYVTTQVVMYNSSVFRKAGLNPDCPPATWDDVARCARVIRNKTGIYGFMPAIKLLDEWQCLGVPVLSFDRKKAVFDSPEGIARLAWYADLFKADYIPRETLTQGYQGALDRYQSGSLGMLIAGPQFLLKVRQNAPDIYRETRVAPLPRGKAGIVPAATMNVVVPKASRHRLEAVKFALFLTSGENQLNFCKLVPLLPSTIASSEDPFFTTSRGLGAEDEAIKVSIRQLAFARDLSLGLRNSPELGRTLKEAVENALYGRMSPAAALHLAAAGWNEILSR